MVMGGYRSLRKLEGCYVSQSLLCLKMGMVQEKSFQRSMDLCLPLKFCILLFFLLEAHCNAIIHFCLPLQ